MEVVISSRHLVVSDQLRTYVTDKVNRLAKYLGAIERATVHFDEERNPRIAAKELCEVTLDGGGHRVQATAGAVDAFAAVDLVVEKLEHQLHRRKSRLLDAAHGTRVAGRSA